ASAHRMTIDQMACPASPRVLGTESRLLLCTRRRPYPRAAPSQPVITEGCIMINNTESPATASAVRRTLRRVLTLAVALAAASTFGLATGAAAATGSPSNTVCSGELAAGSYKHVTVEGTCNIDGSAMVSGNVSLD